MPHNQGNSTLYKEPKKLVGCMLVACLVAKVATSLVGVAHTAEVATSLAGSMPLHALSPWLATSSLPWG